jgi:hypothetical protein
MHALWDGLLGEWFDEGDVQRRTAEIAADRELTMRAKAAAMNLDPLSWLEESRHHGTTHVYAPEVLQAVTAVSRGLTQEVLPVDLPDQYLRRAGALARVRAAEAGHRLAAIWRNGLGE